jgi:plastocyanin
VIHTQTEEVGEMRLCRGLLIAGATALLLGACGDDDDDDGGGASTSIEATASEFKFEPNAWTVPAGQEFTIEFQNDGSVEHEWAVLKLGENIASEDEFAEDKVLFEVEAIPAGESSAEQFTVDDPGTYQVICAVPSHFNAGMEGTLTVE